MMKKPMILLLIVCAGFSGAKAQLKVDFGVAGSPVESGYQAYTASHEVGNTFVDQSFDAFGRTITVALTWPSGAADTAKQMFDRTTDTRYAYTGEHGDLLRDWTGTDGRVASANPLVVTLSGLPAGVYSWLSYHHDGIDQTGVFSVTVKDASGSATTADLPITNSSGGDNVVEFASVSTFATEFTSNGMEDVVFEFNLTSSSAELTTAFFVMNAFDVEALGAINLATAHKPSPSDKETDILPDATMSWMPGQYAASHDVYLGTVFEDVNNASRTAPAGLLVSQGQDANAYDPANLEFGRTYYWRVDEVNAPDKPGQYKGNVWSFTVEPYSYPITPTAATASSSMNDTMGPANTINRSGLDPDTDQHSIAITDMWVSSKTGPQPTWIQYAFDRVRKLDQMWVWNSNQAVEEILGYGVKQARVEVSTDGTTWTEVPNVPEFAQGTGLDSYVYNTTVDLGGAVAQYVKLTCLSTWGGGEIYSLSEVRFFEVPMRARGPEPASGATDVQPDALLTWRPGRQAARHEVYLGTDPNALVLAQTVTDHQVALNALGAEYGQTYYWQVDEVNDAALPQSWEGDVWSLSTPTYRVVDDFESYNDQCNRVYYAWKGGAGNSENADCGQSAYGGNGTGSIVGNDNPPYAERTRVHSGAQAMPFSYDNTSGSGVSEAALTFSPAQDWTAAGLKTLVLFFRGDLANGAGQVYVKINGTKVSYSGSASALQTDLWTQWNVDLSSLSVQAVSSLTIGVSGTGQGVLYVDDIRLYRQAPTAATEQVYIETESATPAVPEPWVITDDVLVSGARYVTTPTTAENSTDGPTVGVLTYPFTVAGGDYRLWFRIGPLVGYSNDSLWVRIQGATINPTGNAANPGWVRFNGMAGQSGASTWHWGAVWDDEHGSAQVTFTLPAGTHTLEVAHREAGVPLDAILIANN